MAATVGAGEIGYDVIQELDKYGATAVTGGNNVRDPRPAIHT